jgi:hypothetical protein
MAARTSKRRAKSSRFKRLLGIQDGSYAALPPVLFPDGKPSSNKDKDIFRSLVIVNVSNSPIIMME